MSRKPHAPQDAAPPPPPANEDEADGATPIQGATEQSPPAPETNQAGATTEPKDENKTETPPPPPAKKQKGPTMYRAIRDSYANGRRYERDQVYPFHPGQPVSEHFEIVKQ